MSGGMSGTVRRCEWRYEGVSGGMSGTVRV